MAMEFIDGVTLKDLIAFHRSTGQPLPIEVITHIAWQITEALDYIHNRVTATGRRLELVHRDLNPPNIMLTTVGDAKLADFGIAAVAGRSHLTSAGTMRGKLGYAAPEQARAEKADSRADLFAWGLTLHEALTSERVFKGENEAELLKNCLEGPLVAPSTLRPDVPPALDHIVMGLLVRELSERIQTASELRRLLLALPSDLLEIQRGRMLLALAVTKTRDWLAQTRALHSLQRVKSR